MPNYIAKVIFVGVGKASLLRAFVGNQFEPGSSPTVAPPFCVRRVDLEGDTTVDLRCWDIAGQERFPAISRMYYRGADIAVVCYSPEDVTSIQTWADRVLEVTPTCKIFAVVTESDTFDRDVVNRDETAAATLLKKYSAERFVTSVRTGDGVSRLIEAVAVAAVLAPDGVKVVELKGKKSKKQKCS